MLEKSFKSLLLFCISITLVLMSCLSVAKTQMAITAIEWPSKITSEMLLGKRLFFDKSLSKNSSISCSSCHQFEYGGSSLARKSPRFDGSQTSYNTTSIFNLTTGYKIGWIGQFNSIQEHLNYTLANPHVMGLSWLELLQRLKDDKVYSDFFDELYSDGVTKDNFIASVVAYESALTTPSPFDQFLKGDDRAISEEAKLGYEVFQRHGCITCHQGKNVGGNLLQKIGVVIPYKPESLEENEINLGRYIFTKRLRDIQVFRVPSLRNVALTAPYLHDGSVGTLPEMIRIMAKHQLGKNISDSNIELIVEFLKSLSGQPHPELLP